jgi:hypothetical protein
MRISLFFVFLFEKSTQKTKQSLFAMQKLSLEQKMKFPLFLFFEKGKNKNKLFFSF